MQEKHYIIDLGIWDKRVKVRDKMKPFVVAVLTDKELAHSLAECYSYIKHTNGIYGLFSIYIAKATEIQDIFTTDAAGEIAHAILAFNA